MLDSQVYVYEKQGKMVVADSADIKRLSKIGVRRFMRTSGLSQKTVHAIIKSKPVRCQTFEIFIIAMEEAEHP